MNTSRLTLSLALLLSAAVVEPALAASPATQDCPHSADHLLCTSGAYRVLPRIAALTHTTGETDREPVVHGGGGDRHEIGLFTEWQSEYIATGNHESLIISHADTMLAAPWCDYETMHRPLWKKNPKGQYGLSFSHTPNLFFLPWLLTGDDKYVAPMECIYKISQQWVQIFKPRGKPMKWLTGRNLAWQLRNLGELAYIEKHGGTTEKMYLDALERTRLELIDDMQLPIEKEFHVLGETRLGNTDAWSGWFEGFIGHTVNHLIQLGFDEWRIIAEWHFKHLEWRCGGKWPMKACDNDHVTPAGSWATTPVYGKKRIELYEAMPDDLLMPIKVKGKFMTYHDRAQIARGWAALAASNCIAGAKQLADRLQAQIDRRGGPRWYKYHFVAGECE